jgi:gliding motility-associated-like protein
VIPGASTTYTVTGTDANGCSATSTVTVNLFPLPLVNAGLDVSICIGDDVQLNATGAVSYVWAGAGLNDYNIPDPIASPTVTTNYMVTGTDANGCQATDFVEVTVNPRPIVTASPDIYIYEGDCVGLSAGGASAYLWSPSQPLDDPTSDSPIACPGETTVFYVVGTDANGCSNIDSTTVFVIGIPVVEVPTGFTPNADSWNDIFRIERWLHFELVTMRVFNRWGDLVFETDDITSGWDGTAYGQSQPIGTYVYTISGVDEKGAFVWRQGNVTLLR